MSLWPGNEPLEMRNSSSWTIGHCRICVMRGTQWPPLSWLLRWHLNRMRR